MSVDQKMDSSRRTLLLATSAAGGVAAVATAVPFVASLTPSERAKAAGAPVEADVSKLKPGEMRQEVAGIVARFQPDRCSIGLVAKGIDRNGGIGNGFIAAETELHFNHRAPP